jgi:hypothetical protein
MPRLHFDEVTIKTFGLFGKTKAETKYYLEIKGKRFKETGIKSVLLTRQEIQNSEEVGEELEEIFYSENFYDKHELNREVVADISRKWKWRMTWLDFLHIRFCMNLRYEEVFEKYFNKLEIIRNYKKL